LPKASRGRRPAPNPKKKTRLGGFGAGGLAVADGATRQPEAPVGYAQGPVARPSAMPAEAPESARSAARRDAIGPRRRGAMAGPTAARRRFADSVGDYWYVGGDLRRIGLMAGGLVGLLVALSFVIR